MQVYFCEKPSVGRLLAEALGATDRCDGYIAGDGIAVTWGFGHLVGFAEPHIMSQDWDKPWRKEVLPMVPDPWELAVLSGSTREQQRAVVKNLFDDAASVVCATDAGREGELIFRNVYALTGCTAPVTRFWVSDLTPASIRKGLETLKTDAEMEGLHQAAKIRAQADWLLGLNCTRAFTLHHAVLCTVGRVQTPTLAMVAARQQAIADFKPEPFWEVTTDLHGLPFKVVTPEKNRFSSKADAEKKLALEGSDATVTVFDQAPKEIVPPQLFDLAALQVEAGKRLDLTAAQTLEMAQRLYESQAISYPRTESRHLSENMVPELPKILEGCPKSLKAWVPDEVQPPGTRFVDDARLTDHHAIIPTGFPSHDDEAEPLFLLIWQRFLAMFAKPKVEVETNITLEAGCDSFTFKGKLTQEPGWSAIAGNDTQDDVSPVVDVVIFAQGQTHKLEKLKLVEGKTKPPKPYTDGSLISAMKNVGRTIDDAELAAHMHGGLGTPATRAEIIEKLLRIDLMTRNKKTLAVTDKGLGLLASVVPEIKTPELTAAWETLLKEVEQGTTEPAKVYQEILVFVGEVIPKIWESKQVTVDAIGECPKCGGGVRATKKAYGCMRWRDGCDFTIWREVAGKKITEANAVKLLTGGKTGLIKGFMGRKGKFDANLILDGEHKVKFHFPPRKKK